MRTCESCGFDSAEEGRPCSLCGASEVRTVLGREETLALAGARRGGARPGPPPASGDRVGQTYADRFRVEALLGRGGMGEVFRVRDTKDGTLRALKVLLAGPDDEADRVERFKREIGILARLRHPAIPRVVAWGSREGELFFVSELIDGPDLKAEIVRRGAWPAAEAAPLVATVAEALHAAHGQGIVHRDVKPNNIMIASDGSVRLLDFGLARGVGIDMATLTRTGMIVGTPGYMSPEQFDGLGVDERTDVYSLGVVFFELLTGRLPFTGQTPLAVALGHKTSAPPAPRALRADVPAWAERIALRCLEKDPARRFASAAELAAELRRPRGGRPVRRTLESGDVVVEDEAEVTDWALVLDAPREKTGWSVGMALRFDDRYLRLEEAAAPAASGGRWTYRFSFWPEAEILRKIVDYEQDWRERAAAEEGKLSSRLQRWISRRE